MFYEASELDFLLTCGDCNKKFVDPRILPCGITFCNSCIDFIVDTGKRQVKCQRCGKTHEVPQEGFPPNIGINKILQLKSAEVIQSKLVDNFKNVLNLVSKKYTKIEIDLQTEEASIRDDCDKVRNITRLAIEEAHAKLDEIHRDLIEEIDKYERLCQQQLTFVQKNKQDTQVVLKECRQFCTDSEAMLKQFKIEESDIQKRLKEANILLNNLDKIEADAQSNEFKNFKLKFLKEQDNLTVGHIKKKHRKLRYLETFHSKKEIDLLKLSDDVFTYKMEVGENNQNEENKFLFLIQPFKQEFFLGAYVNKAFNLNLFILNKDGEIVSQNKSLILDSTFSDIIELNLCSDNNIFYIYTEEKHKGVNGLHFNVRSYDENLKQIKKFKINSRIKFLNSFEGHAFIGVQKGGHIVFSEYTSNFDLIQEFGKGSNNKCRFFFPSNINNFLISDMFYVMTSSVEADEIDALENVVFINKQTGSIEKRFNVKGCLAEYFYLEKFILTFENDKIYCYNFDGDLLDESQIQNELNLMKFRFFLNEKIYFLDYRKNHKLKLVYF